MAGVAGSTGRAKGRKQQQMPLCTYGLACTRRDCVYRHPPKPKLQAPPSAAAGAAPMAPVCMPFLAGYCSFGASCRSDHPAPDVAAKLVAQYAATPCRWGEQCVNEYCLYLHPWSQWDDQWDDQCVEIPPDADAAAAAHAAAQPFPDEMAQMAWALGEAEAEAGSVATRMAEAEAASMAISMAEAALDEGTAGASEHGGAFGGPPQPCREGAAAPSAPLPVSQPLAAASEPPAPAEAFPALSADRKSVV